MFFNYSKTFNTRHKINEIKSNILGAHFSVHDLDFEIGEKDGIVKVIPHTENAEDRIYTLPITHLHFIETSNGTSIKMKCKPRRIDIGGITLLLLFSIILILVGFALLNISKPGNETLFYIIFFGGVLLYFFFWWRLHIGYFDYIKKIKAWVNSHC
ncbi:MAG: hypothetical protein KA275_08355 [Chitinophagaceae bacterium]|nr:hypothetical protein [Chitinophagaceae bacterium]